MPLIAGITVLTFAWLPTYKTLVCNFSGAYSEFDFWRETNVGIGGKIEAGEPCMVITRTTVNKVAKDESTVT